MLEEECNTHSIMFAMRLKNINSRSSLALDQDWMPERLKKCKIILQPNWAPLSLPSYSNLGTKMWNFAPSPKIGVRHCCVFQLPWWARRIFVYSEVKNSFSLAIIGCVRVEVFHFSIISPWCQGGSSRAWWAGSWHGGWSREGSPEGGFRLSLQPAPG